MFEVTITEIKMVEKEKNEYQKIAEETKENEAIFGYVKHKVVEEVEIEIYKQIFEEVPMSSLVELLNRQTISVKEPNIK